MWALNGAQNTESLTCTHQGTFTFALTIVGLGREARQDGVEIGRERGVEPAHEGRHLAGIRRLAAAEQLVQLKAFLVAQEARVGQVVYIALLLERGGLADGGEDAAEAPLPGLVLADEAEAPDRLALQHLAQGVREQVGEDAYTDACEPKRV
jgi:hypothetical protein